LSWTEALAKSGMLPELSKSQDLTNGIDSNYCFNDT
jgi:hypothetical protein